MAGEHTVTVIAWDGKTLAADKRALFAGAPFSVRKIYRVGDDRLVGVSGCLAHGLAMLRWLAAGADVATFPPSYDDADHAILLVIHRDGRIERYENRADPITAEDGKHATGSARTFALMAMHLGQSARSAVELTCELSAECGNGVDTLTFEP